MIAPRDRRHGFVMSPASRPRRTDPALQTALKYGCRQHARGVQAGRRQLVGLVILLAVVAGAGWGVVLWGWWR